jgi:uncharacterized protein (DUF488 family)
MLYTIGHSNRTAEEFLAHLGQHGIALLVDVRSAPYSRYVPHFNKSRLENLLLEHGITYHFAGLRLGGRPDDPTVYYEGRIDYAAVLQRDWYQAGLRDLLALVAGTAGAVAIMCSEGDPDRCHRHHLIARSLGDPAWRRADYPPVVHILRDGSLRPVTESDFAGNTQQRLL